MPLDKILAPVLMTLALFALGYCVIRILKLNLPKPRTFYESLWAGFWIYPRAIDRKLIVRNKLAWLVVVIITYLIVTSVFIG